MHTDRTREDRIYISGLGVLPEMQRLGLGSRLIDDCLDGLDEGMRARRPILTVTSPRNLVVIRLICSRGFRARRILHEHFGVGRDRLGCQLTIGGRKEQPMSVDVVEAADLETLYQLVEGGHRMVQDVRVGSAGVVGYELASVQVSDFPPTPTSVWR